MDALAAQDQARPTPAQAAPAQPISGWRRAVCGLAQAVMLPPLVSQIGRASCRERVSSPV